jgi:hypothetical protein
MTDRKTNASPRDEDDDQRLREKNTQNKKSNETMVGQEASQGLLPVEHDHEHQSNYGGGGENGGV